MSTVEILRAAKARIDTPEKWWNGKPCGHPGSLPDGAGRCAVLTIKVVAGDPVGHPAVAALARGMGVPVRPIAGLMEWNDSHTHAEVMAAFDTAIANEEAREQEHHVPQVVTVSPVELVNA